LIGSWCRRPALTRRSEIAELTRTRPAGAAGHPAGGFANGGPERERRGSRSTHQIGSSVLSTTPRKARRFAEKPQAQLPEPLGPPVAELGARPLSRADAESTFPRRLASLRLPGAKALPQRCGRRECRRHLSRGRTRSFAGRNGRSAFWRRQAHIRQTLAAAGFASTLESGELVAETERCVPKPKREVVVRVALDVEASGSSKTFSSKFADSNSRMIFSSLCRLGAVELGVGGDRGAMFFHRCGSSAHLFDRVGQQRQVAHQPLVLFRMQQQLPCPPAACGGVSSPPISSSTPR